MFSHLIHKVAINHLLSKTQSLRGGLKTKNYNLRFLLISKILDLDNMNAWEIQAYPQITQIIQILKQETLVLRPEKVNGLVDSKLRVLELTDHQVTLAM
jgi:hypothetical protein